MSPETSVVVIGGGIAGLATAYELHRAGIPFQLFEASGRLGGVIISERVGEFIFDGGPDAMLIQKPDGLALCRELGIADRLIPTSPPRLAFIQRDGQLHALPAASVLGIPTKFGPFIRTRLFSWPAKLRMGAEWFIPKRTDPADESIGHFMTRRFGQEATQFLAEPLLAGIHAGDVNKLSLRALFPRFADAEAKDGSLLRSFRKKPSAPPIPDGPFRSFPGGMSDLVTAIAATLPADAVTLQAKVTSITRDEHGYLVATDRGTTHARAVVVATPAYTAAALLQTLNPTVSTLANEVPYNSAGTVLLAYRRDAVRHPLNGSGFVVPSSEKSGITAGSWLSSKWAGRAPADTVILRGFVGGARHPRALEQSDDELIRTAIRGLDPLLGLSGEPLVARVYRFPRANAQHEVGHLDRMAAVDRALTASPGLFVTGSGFRAVGIPDVVADGRKTAKQVITWLGASI